jgi:NAD(P)H-hydrate epimerase
MMPLRESRVLDLNAEALGVPVGQLIENAGRALAEHVRALPPSGRGVVVLAGPGNNGADGLAAAALLVRGGVRVRVLSPFPEGAWRTEGAREAAAMLPQEVDLAHAPDEARLDAALAEAGVVVDALLGAGLAGPLRAPYDAWVRALARHAGKVVAADVPTGFGTPTTYKPASTVTFHDIKDGMDEATCGRIHVAPVGIPEEASTQTGPGEYTLYPRGRWDQHKGEGGIVLIIGGGPYTGAPAVAGMAALRAGADLAIILTPERAWEAVASYSPNLVVRPLNGADVNLDDPANRVTLNSWLKKAKSVVLGPGLGLMAQAQKSVHHVLQRAAQESVPVVVDADALTALAERHDLLAPNVVLTPHAREFRTLTQRELPAEPEKRAQLVHEEARKLGGAWLVKGPVDVISDGERVKMNPAGHPAMSVGGTGDALAGVVGALLAKGMTPFDAARLGARLTGDAGALAAGEKSWGLVATDVVEALPAVLVRHLGRRLF